MIAQVVVGNLITLALLYAAACLHSNIVNRRFNGKWPWTLIWYLQSWWRNRYAEKR